MARRARARGVRDEIDRIGRARVFRVAVVVEIELARLHVHHDVLEHRAEALGRRINLRLRIARKLDHLGVAAAFEIEDAVFRPAMLVVAHQRARRIRGQRRLARAGEAEEDGRLAVGADIGRAMHRHDALGRQEIVEDREDRLLHLAGIRRSADEDHALGEVDRDHRAGVAAVDFRIGLEARADRRW